jgi:citrate/tricarballylate utilization protein
VLDDLFAEAERQLNICNSCRYCEGYCAVFPALERRTLLGTGDITQLANLCHDCRACFRACMYAPPHEFAVDPPRILSAVRLASYDRYLPPLPWPGGSRPGWSRGWPARWSAFVVVAAALLVLAAATEGLGALLRHSGPYQVISYPALLVLVLLPTGWSVAVLLRGFAWYWRDVHGPLRGLFDARAVGTALAAAARLQNMRGGGEECYAAGDDPSPARRRLHGAVAWGFAACFAATVSAAFLQDVLGRPPPYPLLSVPVVLGTAGGLSMLAGCAGLIALRRRGGPSAQRVIEQGVADYGLLFGLGLLALTGLLTLLLRATPAFGLILVVHLATIVVCFAIAPYTRFVHAGYRFLALVADASEQRRPGSVVWTQRLWHSRWHGHLRRPGSRAGPTGRHPGRAG